jgi:hypothetical protein
MKLARLAQIAVATPSMAYSIVFYRDVMGACIHPSKHYNVLIMLRSVTSCKPNA